VGEDSGEGPAGKGLSRALMWAAAIGILAWMLVTLDGERILESIKHTDPLAFLAVAVFFTVITLLLDSVTHWWVFNRFNSKASFKTTLRARGETYLLLSLGFLYGQGGMAYLYSKRADRPLGEVTGSIFFIMLNTLIALMVFPTIAVVFFFGKLTAPEFAESLVFVKWWLIVTWPLIVAHFVFWARDWKFGARQRAKDGVWQTFDKAGGKDYLVMQAFRGLQTVLWILGSFLALMAVGVHVPLVELAVRGPLVGLIAAIPTPGRLGTSQAGWVLLFGGIAGNPEAVIAFSLLWTISVSLIRWAIGALFLALGGEKDISRRGAEARREEKK